MNRVTTRSQRLRRVLIWMALAVPPGGCAGDLADDRPAAEIAREELAAAGTDATIEGGLEDEAEAAAAEEAEAAAGCPGPPPPPMVCNRVVCVAADESWDYQPLAAGTPCQEVGVCDGRGSCVMPAPQPTQRLAIPSDQLNGAIALLLVGSELWLDASGNSPPLITGYIDECFDPPGPIPPICVPVPEIHHSYIRFSDGLKNFYAAETMRTLRDYALPDIGVSCGFAGVCATVNQISGDLGDLRVLFGQSSSGGYARLTLPMHSPSSTVIIDSGMPDVELTNMEVSIYLTLMPTVDQSGHAAVGAADVQAVLAFEANVNNFPDWLADLFYDVSDIIKARVRDGVRDAFADQDRRDALTGALTSAIESYAAQSIPGFTGFASINFISVSGGTLLIDYVPN